MLINFFGALRDHGVPVSIREFLDLLSALRGHVVFADRDDFYHLSRLCLVKDERWFDRFDIAFRHYFEGLDLTDIGLAKVIPEEWLKREMLKELSEEEREAVEAIGGWDKLMEEFKKRLEEQQERHEGGSRWIGVGGTSPYGNSGYNPFGVRVGGEGGERRATKLWEQRRYRNLDDGVQIGTRNIKMALRRLRRFARQGAADEFDLNGTISATAQNAGLLDVRMIPERRNAVKVLLFLDVGGSMDPHVKLCEELFSAARSEFKYLEHFYFHNFIYDSVWRDNHMRHDRSTSVEDILRNYAGDYKVVIVGDAAMSPYEIVQPGGAIDQWNAEPGADSLQRLLRHYPKAAWLNPLPLDHWRSAQSVDMVRELMEGRMYPLTLAGLDEAISELM